MPLRSFRLFIRRNPLPLPQARGLVLGRSLSSGSFHRNLHGGRLFGGLLRSRGVRLFLAGRALGQGSQNPLGPGGNLLTVGGNNIDGTGNGSQGSQNLNDGIQRFHMAQPP